MLALNSQEELSSFVWSKGSEPWSSSRLSSILRREFKAHLNTSVNVSMWRHAAIAISRRHIKGRYFKREYDAQEEVQNRADAQAGHNSTYAGLTYARGIEEAPGHVASARAEYQAVSPEWHLLLGFGLYLRNRPRYLGEVSPSRVNSLKRSAYQDSPEAVETKRRRLGVRGGAPG